MFTPQAQTRRIIGMLCGMQVLLLCWIGRLVWLQVVRHDSFSETAARQHHRFVTLPSERGSISDRQGRPLAVNVDVDSLYAVPPHVEDPEKTATVLSSILNVDRALLHERLTRRKSFVWLARRLSEDQVKRIRALDMKGLAFQQEPKRFYPNQQLASHVIGYTGLDHVGLEGIELLYNEWLAGTDGTRIVQTDGRGRPVASKGMVLREPVHGHALTLALDQVIQNIAEEELAYAIDKFNARGGTIIVLDPHTGEVLAMANAPSYNPNELTGTTAEHRRNRAITDMYEPGSVFKLVTASAALHEGKVSLTDTFDCERGEYRIANHILHDHRPHGVLTFRKIIEVSSNIGTVKIAQRVGGPRVWEYATRFGFGQATGIDLPGEASGVVHHPRKWSKLSIGAFPIGHEVLVTPLQMAGAMSVIANNGLWVQPRTVREIVSPEGEVVRPFERSTERQVMDEETALLLRGVLAGVVEEGTGKAASPVSYTAAGKTGTAQKINPDGTYSHSKFVASFVGFAPVWNPAITVLVMLDEPRPVYYGGVVAAPSFAHVVESTLNYLQVQPDVEGQQDAHPVYLTRRP